MKPNKIISLIIALLLVISSLTVIVFADESSEEESHHAETVSEVSSESKESEGNSSESLNESDQSDYDESHESKEKSSSSSKSEKESSSSGSKGYRFSGDKIQTKNPRFSELELGDCDPDDGKDFSLKPEMGNNYEEIVIRDTDAEKMTGKDNFYIEFSDCKVWVPIEVPAGCVVDDNINSKLVVNYGTIDANVYNKVSSTIDSMHILQTYNLTLTAYNEKGKPNILSTIDGKIKLEIPVNSACINQYKGEGKVSLLVYDPDSQSLENCDYSIDTENELLTAYLTRSGNFFIINSKGLDVSSVTMLNDSAPFIKVLIIGGTFFFMACVVVLIIVIKTKSGKNSSKSQSSTKKYQYKR